MKNYWIVCTMALLIGVWSCQDDIQQQDTIIADIPPPPPTRYGFRLDSFTINEGTIKRDQFLSGILSDVGISSSIIHQLAEKSKSIFDVRKMRYGKPYALVYSDTSQAPAYFVYEPSIRNYFVYELKDSLGIQEYTRPIRYETVYSEGQLDSVHTSLWLAMEHTGVRDDLIAKMEEALGWTVDFYYVHRGDAFKAIYQKEFVQGEPVGVSQLTGAYFRTLGVPYYAIYFENEHYEGFYDLEGRPMVRQFLKSPVQYSRISSRYNRRRFHPIKRRRIPHLGTDYAAPHGTPIRAVADGTVSKAAYTKGNGNYVKIRHDRTYETQYLHMSKFAKGISPGVRVRQGQTIGYVGSTGLATGPHVCFRFWKDGKQIDHLRLNFPPPEPLPKEDLPNFYAVRDSIMELLDPDYIIPTTIDSMNREEVSIR